MGRCTCLQVGIAMSNFSVCLPAIAEMWQADVPGDRWQQWLERSVSKEEEALVLQLLEGDHHGAILLDIGCGSGRYAHRLGGQYERYYGMDPWEEAVVYARRWAAKENLLHYSFHNLSVFDSWPVEPDIIFTLNVFRHFKDPMAGYRYVYGKMPSGSTWVTSFLTHAEQPAELQVRGKYSAVIPETRMWEFINTTMAHSVPFCWFQEIGDWWLVRIDK